MDDELVPEPEDGERRLNIHLDPSDIAGVYANFANITFSQYEFTLTFARIEHEVEEGDVPGAVVARINASPRFVEELIAEVGRGFYAVSFAGGQVDPTTGDFVFGVSEGYLIEGGKVTKPCRGATRWTEIRR